MGIICLNLDYSMMELLKKDLMKKKNIKDFN